MRMSGFRDRLELGDAAENIRVLHDDRAGFAVDCRDQLLGVGLRGKLGCDVSSRSSVNFAIVVATLT